MTEHVPTKAMHVTYLADPHALLTTGFGRDGERQLCLWDARQLTTPTHTLSAGGGPGALVPTAEPTLSAVFVASKVRLATVAYMAPPPTHALRMCVCVCMMGLG
jgi:hypothetical protein